MYLCWKSGCLSSGIYPGTQEAVLHLERYFISSQNLITQCVKIWAVQLLEFLYSFQRDLCSLYFLLPHLFFLVLRNKHIYWWERRKRETFVLLLLPMNEHKVPYKARFNTWMFSICLHPREEPTYCGTSRDGSAMPESGRRKTQSKLSEPCAKPKMTNIAKISWKDWPFLSLESDYWNG